MVRLVVSTEVFFSVSIPKWDISTDMSHFEAYLCNYLLPHHHTHPITSSTSFYDTSAVLIIFWGNSTAAKIRKFIISCA